MLDKIAEAVGGIDDETLDKLGCDLAIAAETAVVIENEIDLSVQKAHRIRWIVDNIVEPAVKLRTALSHENARMTSRWPPAPGVDELDDFHLDYFEETLRMRIASRTTWEQSGARKKRRKSEQKKLPSSQSRREKIVNQLVWLDVWATDRIADLTAQSKKSSTARNEMFVEDAVRIFRKYFPHLRQAAFFADGSQTPLAKFVEAASFPLVNTRNLTTHLKRAVSRNRTEKLFE